jgi:hypothetical protein
VLYERVNTMTETTLTESIVLSLADVKGVDPLELPPLYDAVDTDALEQLFSRDDDSLELTFFVADCEVTVGGCEDVTVTPVGDQVASSLQADADADATVRTTQDW